MGWLFSAAPSDNDSDNSDESNSEYVGQDVDGENDAGCLLLGKRSMTPLLTTR
jgi:hypothetical protein